MKQTFQRKIFWLMYYLPPLCLTAAPVPPQKPVAKNQAHTSFTTQAELGKSVAGGAADVQGNIKPEAIAEVRELSTDRPDQTESPYTVPKGMFQFELDFMSFTRDTSDGVTTEVFNLVPLNLKYGLAEHTDLQLVFDNWLHQTERTGKTKIVTEGMGDLTVRLKQNLWGNDSGKTALAVMPFVSIPLHASDLGREKAEAGVIVPFGWNLPNDLYLGLMTEWDWLNDDDGGHKNAWFNTATLGGEFTSTLGWYVEFTATVFDNGEPWQGTVDGGLTYALKDDIQLDLGCNVGVTRSAPDIQLFFGLSLRF